MCAGDFHERIRKSTGKGKENMRDFKILHFELDLNVFKMFIKNKLTILQATVLNSF